MYVKGCDVGYKWVYDLYAKSHYLDDSGSCLKSKLFFSGCTVITYFVYLLPTSSLVACLPHMLFAFMCSGPRTVLGIKQVVDEWKLLCSGPLAM